MVALYNKTVLILGGGPSLLDLIDTIEAKLPLGPDYAIITINEAIYLSLYSDILFFRDLSWFFGNRNIVDIWNGTVISSTPSSFYPKKVKVIKTTHCEDFLISGGTIKYGRTSGHLAVSLAINMGAKRCVLVGFDCRIVDGRSHFHDKPSNACGVLYKSDFLPAWNGWGEATRRVGVEVWNATPNSAILEFPYRPLSEIL
jgi:hypothetical protein